MKSAVLLAGVVALMGAMFAESANEVKVTVSGLS